MIVMQTRISKKPHCFLSTNLGTHSHEQDIIPISFQKRYFELFSGTFQTQHINAQ